MRNLKVIVLAIKAFISLGFGILIAQGDELKLQKTGKNFRSFFEDAGGIYVKFGQILSLRKDLLPEIVCDELRQLLDKVSPIAFNEVNEILFQELGSECSKTITNIAQKPLASASLGQVHPAELSSGEKVVIKILRPGITDKVAHDLALLRLVGRVVDLIPVLRIRVYPIVAEFGEWIWEEVDYQKEATNLKEFAEHKTEILPVFNIPLKSKVPKVYTDLTTSKVITMEFIEGYTLNELINARVENGEKYQEILSQGYNYREIGKQFNLITMKQLFIDGYFNADPHPANIIATAENEIYFIDFGLIGRINRVERINVFRLGRAMATFDEETAYLAIIRLLDVKLVKNKEVMREAVKSLLKTLKEAKANKELDYSQASSKAMANLFFIFNKHNIQVPPQIAKALRAVVTGDGLVVSLNPDLDFQEAVQNIFQVTLAATYLELKTSLSNKDKLLGLFLKGINLMEEHVFLD